MTDDDVRMTKPAKLQRRVAAMEAEMGRVLLRLSTLSITLMRADAAYEAYRAALARVIESGMSTDALAAEATAQVERVENSDFTRGAAHLTMCLALLYVVVEGWRKWDFFDARVDALIESPNVAELKNYRHAVFHANEFGDPDVMAFISRPESVQWMADLQNALRRALRAWHANLPDRITEYLRRSPL